MPYSLKLVLSCKWPSFFTSDGVCIFSGTKFSGDLVKMREGMWEKIAKRDHRPERVYRLSDSDLVIYGDATLTTKQGAAIETIFFARMLFDGDKLKFYEVAKR